MESISPPVGTYNPEDQLRIKLKQSWMPKNERFDYNRNKKSRYSSLTPGPYNLQMKWSFDERGKNSNWIDKLSFFH